MMNFYILMAVVIAIYTYRKHGERVIYGIKWNTLHYIFFPSIGLSMVFAKIAVMYRDRKCKKVGDRT